MKSVLRLALVGTISFGLGALCTNLLYAAAVAPKAYLVANITNVTNSTMLKRYQSEAPAVNAAFGGEVLARGKAVEVDPTSPPPGGTIVLIQFPDLKHLTSWYNSAAYSKIKLLRVKSSTTHLYAVEALAKP